MTRAKEVRTGRPQQLHFNLKCSVRLERKRSAPQPPAGVPLSKRCYFVTLLRNYMRRPRSTFSARLLSGAAEGLAGYITGQKRLDNRMKKRKETE